MYPPFVLPYPLLLSSIIVSSISFGLRISRGNLISLKISALVFTTILHLLLLISTLNASTPGQRHKFYIDAHDIPFIIWTFVTACLWGIYLVNDVSLLGQGALGVAGICGIVLDVVGCVLNIRLVHLCIQEWTREQSRDDARLSVEAQVDMEAKVTQGVEIDMHNMHNA